MLHILATENKKETQHKKSLGGICFILDCANGIMGIGPISSNYTSSMYVVLLQINYTSRKLFKKTKTGLCS